MGVSAAVDGVAWDLFSWFVLMYGPEPGIYMLALHVAWHMSSNDAQLT